MSEMLWVKMPSKWINGKVLANEFSSRKDQSTDIAALKLYLGFCLFSNIVTRTKEVDYLSFSYLQNSDPVDQIESELTYSQMSENFSLSRALISKGLKKLERLSLIKIGGSIRKKIYIVSGNAHSGWCKLPKKDLIKKDYQVSAFQDFSQRLSHERNALKIFMYFLAIRSNAESSIHVCRGKISTSTGVNIGEIDAAIKFLSSIGLLSDIKFLGVLKSTGSRSGYAYENAKLHQYFVIGGEYLRRGALFPKMQKPKPPKEVGYNPF